MRICGSLMIAECVVVFESNTNHSKERHCGGSGTISVEHENIFFPMEGVTKTIDLREFATTAALAHNAVLQHPAPSTTPSSRCSRPKQALQVESGASVRRSEAPMLRSRVDEATVCIHMHVFVCVCEYMCARVCACVSARTYKH